MEGGFLAGTSGTGKWTHVEDRALEKILEATGCHPYHTQYLCHILYDVMEN